MAVVVAMPVTVMRRACACARPSGFLVTLTLALLAAADPLLFLYNSGLTADYSLGSTRALTAAAAVLGATAIAIFREPATLYNLALFVHIGFEVYVVDQAFLFARAADTETASMVLAYLGGAVVIVHLLPFLVIDHRDTLSFLAYVGVVVNTLLILLAMPQLGAQLLLVVGLTSVVLLAATLLALPHAQPALLGMARRALRARTCLGCEVITAA